MTRWTPATEPPKDTRKVRLTIERQHNGKPYREIIDSFYMNGWFIPAGWEARPVSWTEAITTDMETP